MKLLSSIYLFPPTREALRRWEELIDDNCSDYLQSLKEVIRKLKLESEKQLEDLHWEYTRLFIGPYKLPCPPLESVYTSPQRLMRQEAFEKVKAFYERTGLTIDQIMPDHIGVELNFLAILFDRLGEKGKDTSYYQGLIKSFLHEHLGRWVFQFTKDLEKATATSFYQALARSTRDCLIFIASQIEDK